MFKVRFLATSAVTIDGMSASKEMRLICGKVVTVPSGCRIRTVSYREPVAYVFYMTRAELQTNVHVEDGLQFVVTGNINGALTGFVMSND